jgi:hypothetical protein
MYRELRILIDAAEVSLAQSPVTDGATARADPFNPPWAINRYWAGRPRSDNCQRLKQATLREMGRSVCTCEQLTGTSAR